MTTRSFYWSGLTLVDCLVFILVPVTESWRDELKSLTDALKDVPQEPAMIEPRIPERPKTQYSETTGRLIPPPSRAMSRGMSRQASRQGSRQGHNDVLQRNFQHIAEDPDMESQVNMDYKWTKRVVFVKIIV